MDRKKFIKSLAILPIAAATVKLADLQNITDPMVNTEKMPVLFLGHGSPMNAIEENEFVSGFRNIAKKIPKPNAILCISAHWETSGTYITAMDYPPTIHDFGGFPKALFDVQYPAPGSPELARQIQGLVHKTTVELDDKWGLDHGAWSVLKHLYPKADVPVIQMSLNYRASAVDHYELAKDLKSLRNKGVLIVGSGNMVHNLGRVDWNKLKESYAYDWALEASEKMKGYILQHDHHSLIHYKSQGKAFDLAIPSPEHYLPLLYTLGLMEKDENPSLFNDKALGGSLTMTSVMIAKA